VKRIQTPKSRVGWASLGKLQVAGEDPRSLDPRGLMSWGLADRVACDRTPQTLRLCPGEGEKAKSYPHARFKALGWQQLLQWYLSESFEADYQDDSSRHTVAQPVGTESGGVGSAPGPALALLSDSHARTFCTRWYDNPARLVGSLRGRGRTCKRQVGKYSGFGVYPHLASRSSF
jgi:hypothetical protein